MLYRAIFKATLLSIVLFTTGLKAHDPEKKSSAQRRIEAKHQMLKFMKSAKDEWVWNQRANVNWMYDSNTNLAPKDRPTTTKADSFIGTLNYSALGYHLFYKSAVTIGGDAEYKWYTLARDLNTGDVNTFGKVQYFATDQVKIGSTGKLNFHYQPKIIDASNIILTQTFTYFGASITPHIIYSPSKDLLFNLTVKVDRKWYQKPKGPGEFPYNNLLLQTDISAEKSWESYKQSLLFSFIYNKYFELPNFDLVQILAPNSKKTLKTFFGKSEHSFPKFFIPFLTAIDAGLTRDNFQGYEDYYYIQPSLRIRYPFGEEDKQSVMFFMNYQRRNYTKRRTLSSLFTQKVHYNTVQTALQYDHQVTKKFSFYEMATYESRITNEQLGKSDRSYTKFTVGIGANYAF